MLFKRRPRPEPRRTVEAIASRAIIAEVSGQLPLLQFTFRLQDGQVITFELEHHEASKFLNQAIAAHSVTVEPLRVPRNTYGF